MQMIDIPHLRGIILQMILIRKCKWGEQKKLLTGGVLDGNGY